MRLELEPSWNPEWEEIIHWGFRELKTTKQTVTIEVVTEIVKRAGKVKENVGPS